LNRYADDEEYLAWFYPPDAKVTEEQWAEIVRQDALHMSGTLAPTEHVPMLEFGRFCGKPMERDVCSCGWKDEWRRCE